MLGAIICIFFLDIDGTPNNQEWASKDLQKVDIH